MEKGDADSSTGTASGHVDKKPQTFQRTAGIRHCANTVAAGSLAMPGKRSIS